MTAIGNLQTPGVCNYKEKEPARVFERHSRGSSCETGAPLPLVASVAESERLNNFPFLAPGAFANLVSPVAVLTDGLAGFTASLHKPDLSTLRTPLVRRRVFGTAVVTDGLAGLTTSMDSFALPANITSTLHGHTSFRLLDFGKSEIEPIYQAF